MRVYDKGMYFGVSLNESEIDAFRRRWPASGLNGLRNVIFEYDKRNGALVDVRVNGRQGPGRFDGEALSALSRDAQIEGARKLGLGVGSRGLGMLPPYSTQDDCFRCGDPGTTPCPDCRRPYCARCLPGHGIEERRERLARDKREHTRIRRWGKE